MPNFLRTLLVAGALSAVITVGLVSWLDSPSETLLYEDIDKGIEKVDVEFGKNAIYLNVHISKPLSCREIINKLGIETLPIKNKVYTPTCSTVSGTLIRIIYTEAITA